MKTELTSRADLHLHSKHSNRPAEWFLRRIGAPESFQEPLAIYNRCRELGMDFVTITDHNCILGGLEIEHLPNVFLSAELTTYFPEDGCKIHCLVFGVTPKQFDTLQEARETIYDLRRTLHAENIPHSIAHPLFRINDKLTTEHIEKLLVLFNRFEGINGSRVPLACSLARCIMERLTPDAIARMADKHGLTPHGPTPWIKSLTGGSDDHGGCSIAEAFTETDRVETVDAFLACLRNGAHRQAGRSGSSPQLADSLVQIATRYFRERFGGNGAKGSVLLDGVLRSISGVNAQAARRRGPISTAVRKLVSPFVRKRRERRLSEIERNLIVELRRLLAESKTPHSGDGTIAQRRFHYVARLGQHLSCAFFERFIDSARSGSLIDALQALTSLGPVFLGMAPFLTAFGAQHKDDEKLRDFARHFGIERSFMASGRRLWATDTLTDVNGVAHTIHMLAGLATNASRGFTVLSCLEQPPATSYPLRNFTPVKTFRCPDYKDQTLAFPPFLDILHFIEDGRFDEVLISTPGPVGLSVLMAAMFLKIPARGIYHTDFPQYVRQLTDDDAMGELANRFMRWFYGQMATVYAPSEAYRDTLIEMGLAPEKVRILSRGVDRTRFNPGYRTNGYWANYGLNGRFKFIYVGRLSVEKNIHTLLDAFVMLNAESPERIADLVVVGDGPERDSLCARYAGVPGLAFTGYLRGENLSRAYASADALVFPSQTDTFGNVVLEAHASGLPAIVAEQGGPQETVRAGGSGLVVDTTRPEPLRDAMRAVLHDRDAYAKFQAAALRITHERSWDRVLQQLDSEE